MKPVAFVTSRQMDVADEETTVLMDQLRQCGGECVLLAWDADIEWSSYSLVVIRSCWDYHLRIAEFREWAQRTSTQTNLFNPWPVLRWNSHKSYLLDLQQAGVPIMPTQLLPQGSSGEQLSAFPSGPLIAKPAVGIGASGIARGLRDDPAFHQHLQQLLQECDVLVQPYHAGIEEQGETSLIYLPRVALGSSNNRLILSFSHAVRKLPAAGDFRVQQQHGGKNFDHQPTSAELEVAERAFSCIRDPLLYARVDLVHWQGAPVIMELELIEPHLFFGHSWPAVSHFADCLWSLQQSLV